MQRKIRFVLLAPDWTTTSAITWPRKCRRRTGESRSINDNENTRKSKTLDTKVVLNNTESGRWVLLALDWTTAVCPHVTQNCADSTNPGRHPSCKMSLVAFIGCAFSFTLLNCIYLLFDTCAALYFADFVMLVVLLADWLLYFRLLRPAGPLVTGLDEAVVRWIPLPLL